MQNLNIVENNDKKWEDFNNQNNNIGETLRKRRLILRCPHTDQKHYAKNMCHNCYHRIGKTKMAYACEHRNKSHYSRGLC